MQSLSRYIFRLIVFSLILAGILPFANAQNLVPNPSFETYSNCPYVLNAIPFTAPPWTSATGSADYFNACMTPGYLSVPHNSQGDQAAHTGDAYIGLYSFITNYYYRECIQVQLSAPMIADQCYTVVFYVSLADKHCGINHFGAYLSPDAPTSITGISPQVEWQGTYLSDTMEWVRVLGFYIATGGEQYITIGNFYPESETQADPFCQITPVSAYYYVDDVEVVPTPVEPFDLELGGPQTTCDSFVIDPGLDNGVFLWSTGSIEPTITVYTSGTYSVTVSYGCETHEDEIEVTILNFLPVNIPDVIPSLCDGESYTISLDPNAGEYIWQDGSVGSDYTISHSGIYSVTLDGGCNPTTDFVEVVFISPPTSFTLGPDIDICNGDSLHLMLDPNAGNFLWDDQSTSPNYTITSPGTYALTISNSCGQVSDEIEVGILLPPNAQLGADMVTICTGEDVLLEFSPDQGSFLWQDGSTNSYYDVTNTGLYAVTITNACGEDDDAVFVQVLDPPTVDLGFDGSACEGDTIHLDINEPTWTYLWQDGTTEPFYEVTSSGQYNVTVSNECGDASDIFTATFSPAISPFSLGPDFNLCAGDQAVLSLNIPGAQYQWSDLSTSDTLLVQTPGTYFVNVYNSCSSYSDTVVVGMNGNPPVVQLPADFSLCTGQSTILAPMLNGVVYLWNDGTTFPQLSVSTPGTYAVTVSNACGISMDSVIITAGEPFPQVMLGPDTSICAGDTIVVTPASDHVMTWLWHDGSNLDLFEATGPLMITIQASNTCGVAYDTMNVSLLPSVPHLDLGPDVDLCPDDSVTLSIAIQDVSVTWFNGLVQPSITVHDTGSVFAVISNQCGTTSDTIDIHSLPGILEPNLGADQTLCPGDALTLSTGITNVSYLWQDGSTQPTFVADQGGTYHLTISNICGTSSDTIVLTESTSGPVLNLGPDTSICAGHLLTLNAGISGVQYLWQDGSTSNALIVNTAGMYSLTVTNSCGSDADTVIVAVNSGPAAIDLGSDLQLCDGQSVILSPGVSGVQYLWQDGSVADELIVTDAGIYSLTVSNSCGMSVDSFTVQVTTAPPAIPLGSDTVLCDGETLLLSPVISPGVMINWQDQSTDSTYLIFQPGIIILTAVNLCGESSDSIMITYQYPPATFSLGPDTTICEGSSITLHVPGTQTDVMWQDGSTDSLMVIMDEGQYTLALTNGCGTVTDAINITFNKDHPVITMDPELLWCPGTQFILNAEQPFAARYLWSTGETTSSIKIETPGIYSVDVASDCDEVNGQTIVIPIEDCGDPPVFYIPDIFSPNDDGINDLLTLSTNRQDLIITIEAMIYDRWGNMVYHSNDAAFTWDGTFNGKQMQPGVYVYLVTINYMFSSGLKSKVLEGDVTLIK